MFLIQNLLLVELIVFYIMVIQKKQYHYLQNIFFEKIIKNILTEELVMVGYMLEIGMKYDEKFYEI